MTRHGNTRIPRLHCWLLVGGLCAASGAAAQQVSLAPQTPHLDVTRYVVTGDARLSESELANLLAPFLGEQRTLAQIEDAAHALEQNLHARGYVFYRVIVPAQKPQQGVVTLEVIQFTLGKIIVTGNEHFSTDNIVASLPALQPGQAPEMMNVGRDLSAANANPAKQASITFREGTQPETVDADVKVKDTDPLNYFADFTSNRSLDPLHRADNLYRATFGVQDSNLFDRDQVVTASYTTDPQNPNQVSLFGVFYQIPIYGTGMNVAAYYTHSDVTTGVVPQGAGAFDVSGKGQFYGVRLTQAFPRVGSFEQTASVALDEHYYENGTTFDGAQVEPNVGARPLTLSYSVHQNLGWGQYDASLSNSDNIGGGSSDGAQNYLFSHAPRSWDAWRYSADINVPAAGWDYSAHVRGQYSKDALIPGEQFGLGGLNSVRGFLDREVSGDYGYSWNLEAKAPVVWIPQFRPVAFIDGGEVHSRTGQPDETLLSAGLGFRWSYEKLETLLDIAHVFERNTLNPVDVHTRMHLIVSYRF